MGNCFKYLWRLGKKGIYGNFGKKQKLKTDVTKVIWYCHKYHEYCQKYDIENYPWSKRLLNQLLSYQNTL
jgi:hypothetical protein